MIDSFARRGPREFVDVARQHASRGRWNGLEVEVLVSMQMLGLAAGLVVAAITVNPNAAHADAIDGEWCHDTASLAIDGSSIRIPSGKNIIGDYERHGFHYIVPDGEAEAGTDVFMRLQSEEQMLLGRLGKGETEIKGEPEVWNRCSPVS